MPQTFEWNNPSTGFIGGYNDPLSTTVDATKIKGVEATRGDRGANGPAGLARLAELRQNFENAVTMRRKWSEDANEDYSFYYGDQWPQSARTWLNDGGRPSLTLNRIKPIVNVVVGYQTQNRYEPDFLPRTADDLPMAEIRRGVTKYVLDQCNYATVETSVFKDAAIGGIGCAYVGYEYDEFYPEGRIVIRRLSPFDVYFDPEARSLDFSDAEYVFVASWQSKGKIANMFPEWADVIQSFNEDQDLSEEPRGHNGGVNARPEPVWISSDRRKVRLVTCWYKTYKIVNYVAANAADGLVAVPDGVTVPSESIVKTVGYTEIRCATFVQNTLLEDIVSPYDHGRFPVLPLLAYYTGEGDTPSGVVRDIKDPQLEINKRRSQILHIINTTAFNGLITEQGALTAKMKEDYRKFGSKPGQIIEVTQGALTGGRITEVMPKPLPESIARLEQAFADDLRAISGVNEEMMGVDVPANSSGRAIELRQRSAITQIALLFDSLRDFKRNLVELLWGKGDKKGLCQQYYTEEMVIRITDNSEEPEFATVNQQRLVGWDQNGGPVNRIVNDLSVGEFDVVITESPATPSKRYSDFLALMEMMKTPLGGVLAQTIPDIFLELSDLPNKAKIQARLQQAMQQQQQMAMQGASRGGMANAPKPSKPQGSQSNAPGPLPPQQGV